jgi:hypothetical protein
LSKLKRHERKAVVAGISAADAIGRYRYRLSKELGSTKVEDKGQYVLMHDRVRLRNKDFIDIVVYTTDRVYISASPYVSAENFNEVATKIVRIAQESVKKLEELRPITLSRAKHILEFTLRLNVEDEFERMVAVILADTINEIVLREEMKAAEIEGPPLDEGIPEKIKRLKDKGKFVCEEEGIRNIRELRNGIVHRGDIPDKTQAVRALEITKAVLKWCLKE